MVKALRMNDIENTEIFKVLLFIPECRQPFFIYKEKTAIGRNALDQVIGILEIVIAFLLFKKGLFGFSYRNALFENMLKFSKYDLGVRPFLEIKNQPRYSGP